MTTEQLTALGLLVTIIGWAVTSHYSRQLSDRQADAKNQLAVLQEQFAFEREKRSYTLPLELSTLDQIADWAYEGFTQYSQAKAAQEYQATEGPIPEVQLLQQATSRLDWFRRGSKFQGWAIIHDPSVTRSTGPWPPDGSFPTDLPALILSLTQLVHSRSGGVPDPLPTHTFPLRDNLVQNMPLLVLRAVERLRTEALDESRRAAKG